MKDIISEVKTTVDLLVVLLRQMSTVSRFDIKIPVQGMFITIDSASCGLAGFQQARPIHIADWSEVVHISAKLAGLVYSVGGSISISHDCFVEIVNPNTATACVEQMSFNIGRPNALMQQQPYPMMMPSPFLSQGPMWNGGMFPQTPPVVNPSPVQQNYHQPHPSTNPFPSTHQVAEPVAKKTPRVNEDVIDVTAVDVTNVETCLVRGVPASRRIRLLRD